MHVDTVKLYLHKGEKTVWGSVPIISYAYTRISFERSVTLIPGTNLIMMIRIVIENFYRFCDVHLMIRCMLIL
jgi:hypothetical protein